MTWLAAEEPEAKTPPGCRALETIIVPRPRDIGGFEVRRVLPRQSGEASGPSSSSTRWDLLSWRLARASTCGRIRTSGLPR